LGVDGAVARSNLMTVLGVFAGIGILLATAGIYGLVAYSVAERTRELGIRTALGASRSRILRSLLRQGALLALIGIACGLAAAAAFTRILQNFVWGVSTLDPLTFAVVAITLIVVAILASLLPAARAVKLNPIYGSSRIVERFGSWKLEVGSYAIARGTSGRGAPSLNTLGDGALMALRVSRMRSASATIAS
jgi:predicted lysophospholipase L1 biosynthesis ABC-type transport system permease subunit